jgi:hypothetical protein
MSTCIRDPAAFATAYARGTEHPDIRTALETPPTKGQRPDPVEFPISEILGPEGHLYCEGYRLAGEDEVAARQQRDAWLGKARAGDLASIPPPLVVPVDFRDGSIEFRFKVNAARTGHEISTMFPKPPDRKVE